MVRTLPRRTVPSLAIPTDDRATLTYKLKIVTPMVGGSAIAGMPTTEIRPTEIMGNLRFWWRAVNVGHFSLEEMIRQEDAIFGSAVHSGNCQIRLDHTNPGKQISDPRDDARLAYALWPLRDANSQVTLGTEFILTLRFKPGLDNVIRPAMEAFIAYGGLGGRTRRGCGSLQLKDFTMEQPGKQKQSHSFLGPTIKPIPLPRSEGSAQIPGMTGLPRCVYILNSVMASPVSAWVESLRVYQEFRQGPGVGRVPTRGSVPGRSYYPEADTIRKITKYPDSHPPTHPVNGFPRADLGLPIVMQFGQRDEPEDVTIQVASEQKSRFASPIITKAVQQDGGFVPMIAFLESPHVWTEKIELKSNEIPPEGEEVYDDKVNLSTNDLLKIEPLHGCPIREAFEKFIKTKGWQQVQS